MAGKPYIQQAWGVLQTGANSLRSDVQAFRQRADSEKARWRSVAAEAEKKRNQSTQELSRQHNEVEKDSLHKTINEASHEIETSRQKIREIEQQVLQREQSNRGIAAALDNYASQLNSLLARSDFE